MKKLILTSLFISFFACAFSQNYNAIKLYLLQQKFDKAKVEMDKLMTEDKAKAKAETYLYKLQLYSELYADSTWRMQFPHAGDTALDALHTYVAKDPSLKDLKEEGVRPIGILYSTGFNVGRENFMNSKWNESFENFKIAEEASAFANENGFSENKIKIDTTTILYTGYAAQNAGKMEEAVKRYKMLADEKVGGADLEDIYKYILNYEIEQKNDGEFHKYLAIAKELYPNDGGLWSQFDINYLSATADLKDMLAKYKAADAAGTLQAKDYVAYAEMFAQPDKEKLNDLDSTTRVDLSITAADAYDKAFKMENNPLYLFNAGVLNYNIFGTLDQRYFDLRGESPTLKKQREEVQAQQMQYADKTIAYLEQAYTLFKAKTDRTKVESNSLNRMVDYLANLYIWKRDKSKGVNPADYDKYDAKYKQYDAEHDKYKE